MTAHRKPRSTPRRLLDVLAIAASVAISLGMAIWVREAGALQRLMFAIAYLWYAAEALGLDQAGPLLELDQAFT